MKSLHNSARKEQEKSSSMRTKKFLTFNLGPAEYALDILSIQEIRSVSSIKLTVVSDVPAYIIGILKYENHIIPVIDLRVLLHLDQTEAKEFNAIIIVKMKDKLYAILVDMVSEIIEVLLNDIKETPDLFSTIQRGYINGVIEKGEMLTIIFNVEKLLRLDDFKVPDIE